MGLIRMRRGDGLFADQPRVALQPVGGSPDIDVRLRHAEMPAGFQNVSARLGVFKDAFLPQDFFLFQLHEGTPSRSIQNDRSVRKAHTYLHSEQECRRVSFRAGWGAPMAPSVRRVSFYPNSHRPLCGLRRRYRLSRKRSLNWQEPLGNEASSAFDHCKFWTALDRPRRAVQPRRETIRLAKFRRILFQPHSNRSNRRDGDVGQWDAALLLHLKVQTPDL